MAWGRVQASCGKRSRIRAVSQSRLAVSWAFSASSQGAQAPEKAARAAVRERLLTWWVIRSAVATKAARRFGSAMMAKPQNRPGTL